ncbi:tRNA 2-selenouridine(34) synthase MnmH [Gemmobacter fulvus]|uniref:tRNA 2-selenouridine(34) synthase MnmH n=1 Tax=Gemmobacter fulvus TaxID=2840474 RepID=A0A975P4Y9_9RHOB|nr:tRNA 2-selenouridine(34) synthase MnmH [Gemmobacter fulvus]MBT9246971.1 tRNA 2-selenouridine(34) synthase MnmH [Gemmobacter fulvus]QWK89744.1 tRNA 2-selenouridine(34) synthase MnmH [Gemmobacter fulvus]
MAVTLTTLPQIFALGFDSIIDVRSPAEWAEDHIPGAINLPVLNDAERAEVGTIYKQVSPFTARKIGGALVAKNAAAHLQGPLADKTGGWKPLVYCWRGGQRSGSFTSILQQVGWRADVIAGGYKAWRKLVVDQVHERPVPSPVVLLDGNTGSAKTEVLALLAAQGVQVIDLEGMARHRGSLFGALPGGQPSQKTFEGALALALARLDPARPVVVEAESSKVGNCRIPAPLWKAMVAAPRIEIVAPLAARAAYLTRAYADLLADPARLVQVIALLRPLHPAVVIEAWQAQAGAGAFTDLAEGLMARHYDPRYAKHRGRLAVPVQRVAVDSLAPAALPELAARIAARLHDR